MSYPAEPFALMIGSLRGRRDDADTRLPAVNDVRAAVHGVGLLVVGSRVALSRVA
jgi:hypothetical protein